MRNKSKKIKHTIKLPETLRIPNVHDWNTWYMFRRKQIELEIKGLEIQKSTIDQEMEFLKVQFDKFVKNRGMISKWNWKIDYKSR